MSRRVVTCFHSHLTPKAGRWHRRLSILPVSFRQTRVAGIFVRSCREIIAKGAPTEADATASPLGRNTNGRGSVGSDLTGRCATAGLGGLWAAMAHSVRCRRRIYRSHHLRRQRRYRAVGRVGFPAGARGYCDKYGKPKNVHRPSHVFTAANWFVCRQTSPRNKD